MNPLELLDSPVVPAIGWTILHSIWQFILLALTLKLTLLCVSSTQAKARYGLAMLALLLAVLLPAVTFVRVYYDERNVAEYQMAESYDFMPFTPDRSDEVRPEKRLPGRWESIQPVPRENMRSRSRELKQLDRVPESSISTSVGIWEPDSKIHARNLLSLAMSGYRATWQERLNLAAPVVAIGWMLGVILFSTRPVLGWWHVRQLRLLAADEKLQGFSSALQRRADALASQLNLSRAATVIQSTSVMVPTAIGYFRPLVLLPASAVSGLSPRELDAILLHELAHLKRWDDIAVCVQSAIETLFFYHPAIWWVSSVSNTERENCCDDIACDVEGSRSTLAEALLKLAQSSRMPSLTLHATGGAVKTRVQRMLTLSSGRPHHQPRLLTQSFVTLGLVGAIGFGVHAGVSNSSQPINGELVNATTELELSSRPVTNPADFELVVRPVQGDGVRMNALVTIKNVSPADQRLPCIQCGEIRLFEHNLIVEGRNASGKHIEIAASGLFVALNSTGKFEKRDIILAPGESTWEEQVSFSIAKSFPTFPDDIPAQVRMGIRSDDTIAWSDWTTITDARPLRPKHELAGKPKNDLQMALRVDNPIVLYDDELEVRVQLKNVSGDVKQDLPGAFKLGIVGGVGRKQLSWKFHKEETATLKPGQAWEMAASIKPVDLGVRAVSFIVPSEFKIIATYTTESGTVTSNKVDVNVTTDSSHINARPTQNQQGIELSSVVRNFNIKHDKSKLGPVVFSGIDPEPLTVDEVVEGLKRVIKNPQPDDIPQSLLNKIDEMSQTKRLLDQFSIEPMKGITPNDFTKITGWQIRLIWKHPAEKKSFRAFVIRDWNDEKNRHKKRSEQLEDQVRESDEELLRRLLKEERFEEARRLSAKMELEQEKQQIRELNMLETLKAIYKGDIDREQGLDLLLEKFEANEKNQAANPRPKKKTSGESLASAVNAFNKKYRDTDFTFEPTPLTEKEIIDWLEKAKTRREDFKISDAQFEKLINIGKTKTLPPEFELEAQFSFRRNDFTKAISWSIRIYLKDAKGEVIAAFTVRDHGKEPTSKSTER